MKTIAKNSFNISLSILAVVPLIYVVLLSKFAIQLMKQTDLELPSTLARISITTELTELVPKQQNLLEFNTNNCSWPKLTLQDPPGPRIALASAPGSGSSWIRHLIQLGGFPIELKTKIRYNTGSCKEKFASLL